MIDPYIEVLRVLAVDLRTGQAPERRAYAVEVVKQINSAATLYLGLPSLDETEQVDELLLYADRLACIMDLNGLTLEEALAWWNNIAEQAAAEKLITEIEEYLAQ